MNQPAVTIATALIGVIGALVGVALGAGVGQRGQRRLLLMNDSINERRARLNAYGDYLSALRRFRVFIMVEATSVTVIQDPALTQGFVVLIEGSREYMDALQDAGARVFMLAGQESQVAEKAIAVHDALWELAKARREYGRGALPGSLVVASRGAEAAFIETAHQDLRRIGPPT